MVKLNIDPSRRQLTREDVTKIAKFIGVVIGPY